MVLHATAVKTCSLLLGGGVLLHHLKKFVVPENIVLTGGG